MPWRGGLSQVGNAWKEKLLIGGAVGVGFTFVYRWLQEHPWREARMRADCASWDVLPFDAVWVWPYVSMFALVGLAWMTLPDARAVRRFALSLLAVAAVGWLCFWFWPTGCERPVLIDPPLAYRWLVALDQPTNCFPCLHSAFAVIAAEVVARNLGLGWRGLSALGLWLTAIMVAIVALRQHTDVDTLAGIALGAAGAWLDRKTALRR